MTFERINGENGYGVKVVLESCDQFGASEEHTTLTKFNPHVADLIMDRMESDLRQHLSGVLLVEEIK